MATNPDEIGDDMIYTPPQVEITPLPMDGEPPSDKAFITENGTRFRARVVLAQTQDTDAPANGGVRIVPAGVSLSLSLSLLNEDMSVATDASGAFVIMERLIVGFQSGGAGNVPVDPAEVVMRAIREEAYRLEQKVANRAALTDYLASAWSLDVLTPPAPEQPMVLPPEV
jgi:hypothetical protein